MLRFGFESPFFPQICQLVYGGLQRTSALAQLNYFFGGCQLQKQEPHFCFPGDGVHFASRWDKYEPAFFPFFFFFLFCRGFCYVICLDIPLYVSNVNNDYSVLPSSPSWRRSGASGDTWHC